MILFGNFATEGPHSARNEVSLPIALKAPQAVKLKLSVKPKYRSEIHSNFFKLKFLIIFSCIDPTFGMTNPIFVIFSDQSASKMDREAVTA